MADQEQLHPSGGLTYQQILDRDKVAPPAFMRERRELDLGTDPIPASHYTSPELFRLQVEKMWLKTWQMACREEDIPDPGDFSLYEIVGKSVIVIRGSDGSVRALVNSCLHRGRKLATESGHKRELKCAFHSFTWDIDGNFIKNPMAWDFPQCPLGNFSLPQIQVALWGGFVFVNFDLDAPPLETILGVVPRHFSAWHPEKRIKVAHVGKVVAANWLVVAEAFMEAHHAYTTHPQTQPYISDANSQVDVFCDHVSRHISARGFASPLVENGKFTLHDTITALVTGGRHRTRDTALTVPDGQTAREYAAQLTRERLHDLDGGDYSACSEAELLDSLVYNVFPNLSIWGGFPPTIVYRWRPVGLDYASCLMEIMVLQPVADGAPQPSVAKLRMLGDDEPWAAATELGGTGAVVDQDMANLPHVQTGLEASATGYVHFGNYSEMRLRQTHRTLDDYLER
jgi:phenylpropionate dioxygenase-like ring-hydroxylating dioxygenase large terminal subunit